MSRLLEQKSPSGQPPPFTDRGRSLPGEIEAYEVLEKFHRAGMRPRAGVIFIEGTMEAEQNCHRFTIRLRHVATDLRTMDETKSALQWAAPGQVEVAYFLDSEEESWSDIQFEIDDTNEGKTAYFTKPDTSSLKWDRFLAIGLKFGAGTIKYYNRPPGSNGRMVVTIPERRTIHFEIRDKGEALLKNEYLSCENYGYDDGVAAILNPSPPLIERLPGSPSVVTRYIFGKATTTSSEGIKLCCTFHWTDTETPGYSIILWYLHDGEKKIYWPSPDTVRAHVEYKTDREHFRNKQVIRPKKYLENGHRQVRALDGHGLLKDKRWSKYINVRIIFAPGTIEVEDPRYIILGPKKAQWISFYFPFSSESIRGKTKTLNPLPQ